MNEIQIIALVVTFAVVVFIFLFYLSLKVRDIMKVNRYTAICLRRSLYEYLLKNKYDFYGSEVLERIEQLQFAQQEVEEILRHWEENSWGVRLESTRVTFGLIVQRINPGSSFEKFVGKPEELRNELRALRIEAKKKLQEVIFGEIKPEEKKREEIGRLIHSYLDAECRAYQDAKKFGRIFVVEETIERVEYFIELFNSSELRREFYPKLEIT